MTPGEDVTGKVNALAELVRHLRPGWDREGIRTALHQALAGRDIWTVAHLAVEAAKDPTARTPAVIAARDRYQFTPDPATANNPSGQKLCRQCSSVHIPNQTACKRANPDLAKTGAAAARQALTEARTA